MTQTILIVAGLIAALAGAFGFLSLIPPIPSEVLAWISGPIKLMKLFDGILPVHEFIAWMGFAIGLKLGLLGVAFAYRLGSMATGSGN